MLLHSHIRIHNFLLSLIGTAFFIVFYWPSCFMGFWTQLEEKFPLHFYNGTNEIKLSNLTSVKQGHHESILYIRRFRVVKTQCFSLKFSKKKKKISLIWLLLACALVIKKRLSTLIFSLLINCFQKLRPSKAKVILESLVSVLSTGEYIDNMSSWTPTNQPAISVPLSMCRSTCMVEMD